MKIKKPKRIMSLFLAALMCVTSLVGMGTTAYAAEETDDVYLISFPRDGDSNYNAEWGHGSHTFMNGWKTGTSRYTTVRAMGSYTGNICYCIEIGVPQQTGDSYTKKGEDFWDNYPSSYNSTISPDDIKLFIGRIFQYGYTGTISTSWRSQNEGGDKLAHAVATQLLIWETVIGERDENFNKVSTGGKDAVMDQISRSHPLYDKIMSYYNSMAASVQKHSKLPSFLSKTPGSAQEIELEWDGSKYTVTLTDSNNVLSGYKFSSNDSGVQFSVSGNKLTITTEKAPSDGLTITAEKTAQRKGVITWTDGIYGPNGGVQDTVTYAQTVNDPLKGFLKLKVSYGSAKIVKTSEDGKVDGISFRIQGNGIDKTVKTGNGGQIQVDNLMPGVYTVTEQEYDRYEPQESRRVTVVAGQVATVNFNNTLKRGDIEVIKSSEDNFNEGVTFHLYGTSLSGIAVDEYAVTDKNGVATFEDVLISGTYTVHQVSGWEGRELMDDFDVFIAKDAQTYRYLINNSNFESYIQVVKVDAETGKTIPYAGAGFQIYDSSGNLITMEFTYPTPTTVDTFYTDANGSLVTPEKLPYGQGYSIVEVQSPYGYVLDSTPVYFDVTEENSSEESGVTVIKVEKTNMPQKGTISIEKTGEVFFGVLVSGGTDENGQELPVIYQPIYETQGLPDTVYEIRAAEDVVTPDGTLRYSKGELVDTVTTDETGFAKSKELYLGKYEVKEVKAGYGMVLSSEVHTVELIYAGQDVAVTETATSFVNERQKVEVSLEKALETNELFGIGNNGEIKNISFGLFADEELVSASGTSIPKDGLLEIITLDENGRATVGTDLPLGSYYVKELATDEHYQLSGEKYPVVFEYAGQEAATVVIAVNDGEPMENKLIYGSVSGKKVDENGEGLGGALIGLFKSDDVEFTEENALMTVVSGDDGSFSFENVPYGSWYIREIKQPTGFVLDETVYDVNISENEQVVEIEIVNKLVRGNIALMKVDAEYTDTKLTGAVFEVYKDSNDNGELDSEDELIGTLTEKEIGQYEMNDLLYGRYFILESASPDSYIRDEGVYEVFIDTDGKTYQVENTEGKGFANEPMRGNLKIVKTSSDRKVEGFAFRITGENGYDVTLETDENGEIFLEGLRIGEYKISEVNNSASAMYILPADKEAAVQTGSTTVVEMHNELRDTPKTGDDSKLGLWLALAGVSAAGIAACGIIGFKKKKKKEDN